MLYSDSKLSECSPYLVDVVKFEMFQKEQQDGRDRLHDDLLVPVHINSKFHALQHCGPAESYNKR